MHSENRSLNLPTAVPVVIDEASMAQERIFWRRIKNYSDLAEKAVTCAAVRRMNDSFA